MASKQPLRADLTSDLKFMAQTTYATMFIWTVSAFFLTLIKKKKEEEFVFSRPVGFDAGNKPDLIIFRRCRQASLLPLYLRCLLLLFVAVVGAVVILLLLVS